MGGKKQRKHINYEFKKLNLTKGKYIFGNIQVYLVYMCMVWYI